MQKDLLLNRIKKLSSPVQPQKTGHAVQLNRMDNIKCVAFDFYGTMFISSAGDIGIDENQDKEESRFFKDALQACNLKTLEIKAAKKGIETFNNAIQHYIDKMKAQGIDCPEPDVRNVIYDVLIKLKKEKIIDGNITRNTAELFIIEFEFRSNQTWPLPDLLIHIKHLKKMGLKLGIISNSQFYSPLTFEALTGITINDLGFSKNLQKWSFRHKIKKPSLAFYQLFINELPDYHLKPKEVLYVGNDLFKDIIPAKKLGMKTALFVGDTRSIRHNKTDLIGDDQPNIIIDELKQIAECLE